VALAPRTGLDQGSLADSQGGAKQQSGDHSESVFAEAPLVFLGGEKGSVTIDGISLTVAGLDEEGFEVAIIPHTREVTTLGSRGQGDRVNVEVDVLAKYVERLLQR
jgi:riboflavin synthase alpha subunit